MSVASTKNYVAGFISPDNVSFQALNLTSISPLTGESTFITLSTNEDEELLINDIPVSGGGGSGYALLGSSNTFTQPNLFNGAGPSTLQIGNSEGFTMSLTAIDTPGYALQISNGGLYLGNLDGSPENSKFVLLACDETNSNQLNIYGALEISTPNTGGTVTLSCTNQGLSLNGGSLIANGITCNGNINANNGIIIPQSFRIDTYEVFIDSTVSYAQTSISTDENGLTINNDFTIYGYGSTNSIRMFAATDTDKLLNLDGSLDIAIAPPTGDNSQLVPTTAWVNSAIAAASIPTIKSAAVSVTGTSNIVFSPAFTTLPVITIGIGEPGTGTVFGFYAVISSKTINGFTVTVFDSTGSVTTTNLNINYIAISQ
jgi:hypothetical protein